MGTLSADQIAELKSKHPGRRLLRLASEAAEVVALSPNWDEMAELKAMLDDKGRAGAAMEWLVRKCVVSPESADVDALLAQRPLLVEGWYQALRREAGADETVTAERIPEAEADALVAKHPGFGLAGRALLALTSPSAAPVTVKVPSQLEMREFRRRNQSNEREVLIAEWLARTCIVEPDAQGLKAILDRKPLLIEKWFVELINAGGAAEKVEVGEL